MQKLDRKAYFKRYYQEHRAKYLAHFKQWRQDNKDRDMEQHKQWRQDNKEYKTEYAKQYRQDNKEQVAENEKRYWQTEEGKAAKQRENIARRTRIERVANTLIAEEWLAILAQHNFQCVYCGCSLLNLFNRATRDHIIPISKGGGNTKENIVPACRSCNSKKHDKIMQGEEQMRRIR
ncbi:MAG TPA: HNH endonuclease signature motif containing protein [Dehalococcoidia bacterium]|nr:HNH endonuclease signature motif containing protein [Dehalococcoidia bacterium]